MLVVLSEVTLVINQVGATFILETEKSNDIAFALKIVQEWNPDWDPKHWITDCAMAEITAIEECFKGELYVWLFIYQTECSESIAYLGFSSFVSHFRYKRIHLWLSPRTSMGSQDYS